MGVRGLQSYILAKCPDSLIPVELTANTDKKKRLIVVEGWSCLRSVYGPHMDFICGGQWQEFRASIRRFVNTFQQANCELAVFFSGGVEDDMRAEWARKKSQNRDTVNMVMQGLRQRGYAPDRKHFLPNETHPQVFRQVLLNCHVKVISTPFSTDKTMVEYAHKHSAYGILANDSDFIMMNAPRYLSLHHLRISGNTISTVIIDREKISDCLSLPLSLFPLLSCLLGNDVINYEILEEFHQRLLKDTDEDEGERKKDEKEGIQLVSAVIDFVKNLESEIKMNISTNVSTIIKQVLPDSENTEEVEALFLSGLEQYKESQPKPDEAEPIPSTVVTVSVVEKEKVKTKPKEKGAAGEAEVSEEVDEADDEEEEEMYEEEEEEEKETVDAVEEITEMIGEAKIVDDGVEEKAVEAAEVTENKEEKVVEEEVAKEDVAKEEVATEEVAKEEVAKEEVAKEEVGEEKVGVEEVAKEEVAKEEVAEEKVAEKEIAQEEVAQEEDAQEEVKEDTSEDNCEDLEDIEDLEDLEDMEDSSTEESTREDDQPQKLITVPAITSKVLSSAAAAHGSGTLNTHLYPLMCTGTLSLGPLFEDNKDKDTVSSALLYRTARQRIYGLVFGVGRGWVKSDAKRQRSTKIDTQRQVTVKEFIVNGSKKNLVEGEEVVAMPVHAPNAKQPARKPTPHIDRLWIGMSAKIQELRRSTLLAIMNSNIPSFFSPNIIANEYLLVCIVLRYVLTTGNKVLREYELDAFLATALSPQLHFGPSHLYKITPGRLTSRGCTLAHIFVRGVETLLLANDACNYPINRRFCFIGNFFDGKLFQLKLGQCRAGLSLLDICDGDLGAVDYFRHLRCVVTEELPRSVFASPPLGPMGPPRGVPGRGPPPMRPPHDAGRMKYSEPGPRPPYNNHGGNRGMYRPYGPRSDNSRPQYRPPYGPPPPGPYSQPPPPGHGSYNQHPGNGPYNQPPPPGHYNQGSQPPRPQHYNNQQPQPHKQYNNRRYPSNNYEQNDNYHENYNNNYSNNNSYNNHGGNNFQSGGYNNRNQDSYSNMNGGGNNYSYKQGTDGPPQNGYYRGGEQQHYSRGDNPPQQRFNNQMFGGNKVPGGGFKDNDPYGKRNVPDRSDTKQWINFLGN